MRENNQSNIPAALCALRERVLRANLDLVKNKLVLFTWGNVSAIDRALGLVVIKPSGVKYDDMKADDMVVTDLDGKVVFGSLRPSTDLMTHLELYRAHPEIGGVVHTHSTYATAFAQADRAIPMYGTTHADYFHGDIPCARTLIADELDEYEKNTGRAINETVRDTVGIPACLAAHHGVFAWGRDAEEAVYNATVVEEVAKMATLTEQTANYAGHDALPLPAHIADKHYERKHGSGAYYGQIKNSTER